jgi:SAM-dependent methyltransferase
MRSASGAVALAAAPTAPAACPACGSSSREVWLPSAFDYITGAEFSVRRCTQCGLGQTEPAPASMDRFYPARYRQYGGATLKVLRALYQLRVRGWMRYLPERGTALEVGCGEGWMLGALRDRGWRVVGSERSAEGAQAAKTINGIAMFVGDLNALAPSRFNLVILFQSLEHLRDPLDAIRKSAALLQPGGMIVVAVPNAASWQARAFGRFWFHLDVPRHLQHFSPQALGGLFQQIGLRVVRARVVSPEHDPYGVLQSLLNRVGFPQNLMTRTLMGMPVEASPLARLAMWSAAALLLIPSAAISLWGWAVGSGAIVEMWAVKA